MRNQNLVFNCQDKYLVAMNLKQAMRGMQGKSRKVVNIAGTLNNSQPTQSKAISQIFPSGGQ